MNIDIFTDTACHHNGSEDCVISVGIYIPSLRIYYSSIINDTQVSTVNRGELFAILIAMNIAIKEGYENISIYSDSAYAVNVLNGKWNVHSFDNINLIDEILATQSKLRICQIFWVKGHDSNTGNNVADALAVLKIHEKIGDKYKLLKKYKKFKEAFGL